MKKFCDIQSRNELADFLKIPRHTLTYILYVKKPDNCYSTFEIPKKNGGIRKICAPTNELKSIQRSLANYLWLYQNELWKDKGIRPNISHAFYKNKSIISNAKIHRNKRFVLNLDLEDFFSSFHFGRVQGYFEKNRDFHLPREVAVAIAQLTCYQKHLPQGAPTSPIITNLICQILDIRLLQIAKKYKLDYTRYADDLTFSTNDHNFLAAYDAFFSAITSEIHSAGFRVNHKKTRLQFKDSRQFVTGLVVNKKLNVPRQYYKNTKAMAHKLYTTGTFEIAGKTGTLNQLEGRFSFIDQLEHYNNSIDTSGAPHNCYKLHSREKEYQAFLFYKYFFSNERPVIVTEGKTDILYLKAAIKHFHLDYPNLIKQDSDGNFEFKVSFFRKSNRWKYFYRVTPDGADTMKNLYRFFVPGRNTPNLLNYFQTLCQRNPKNATIFLFDNETKSDRPLKKFLREISASEENKEKLNKNYYLRIVPESKLYILTNPLVHGKSECEIEDLFTDETLLHEIGGKHFSKSESFDTEKYYGKDIFSNTYTQTMKKLIFQISNHFWTH